ncbi:MAG: hypothetical protein FWH37_04615 [Candidatus Bathyarchaeota archaeon]|nr:hypothetical protein [Candidatus Termiticorpusculum sp.]
MEKFSNPVDYDADVRTAIELIELTLGFKTNRARDLMKCDIIDRTNSKLLIRWMKTKKY